MHFSVQRSVFCLLLAAGLAYGDWYDTLRPAAQRAARSVVRVEVPLEGDRVSAGSGVYLVAHGAYYLITAFHVIDTGSEDMFNARIQPLVQRGVWCDLSRVALQARYFRDADITVLLLNGPLDIPGLFPARLSRSFAKAYQEVFTVGNSPHRTQPLLIGEFLAVSHDKRHFGTNVAIAPGDSGAPLFAWEDGDFRVVGILVSITNEPFSLASGFHYDSSRVSVKNVSPCPGIGLNRVSIGATVNVRHLPDVLPPSSQSPPSRQPRKRLRDAAISPLGTSPTGEALFLGRPISEYRSGDIVRGRIIGTEFDTFRFESQKTAYLWGLLGSRN